MESCGSGEDNATLYKGAVAPIAWVLGAEEERQGLREAIRDAFAEDPSSAGKYARGSRTPPNTNGLRDGNN